VGTSQNVDHGVSWCNDLWRELRVCLCKAHMVGDFVSPPDCRKRWNAVVQTSLNRLVGYALDEGLASFVVVVSAS